MRDFENRPRSPRGRMRLGVRAATSLPVLLVAPLAAQTIVPDGSLGTAVNLNGTTYEIGGGTRSGDNLFQSFARFDLPTSFTGDFRNTTGGNVSNVISRVTRARCRASTAPFAPRSPARICSWSIRRGSSSVPTRGSTSQARGSHSPVPIVPPGRATEPYDGAPSENGGER